MAFDRRHKDRVTIIHQWMTLLFLPIIAPLLVTAFIGGWSYLIQIRDDTRDNKKAVAEIQAELPRQARALADHETRIRVIEADRRWR